MKKILSIIALTFLIFQIAVAYTAIDIGDPAIDRESRTMGGYTNIVEGNPANITGKITNVEMYVETALEGCEVATFYKTDTNDFSTRDSATIGDVAVGYSSHPVSIDVVAGDYIGLYYSVGYIEYFGTEGAGRWRGSGDKIPCTEFTFAHYTGASISLYGTGETVPDQVTNVQATDGAHTDKVVVTWNVASGADKYYVWQGSSWIDVGLVTTWDHTGAPAPTITVGTASASDGTSSDHVTLSVAGESANNGSSISYKVKAWNTAGYGAESASNSGYRGVGTLTYQWQRSAGDSDADYSNIDGATTDPYNDTGAPENGDGRYYKCIENAAGASQQVTNSDRGYRGIPVGWEHKWNTKEITKWNTKEILKWDGLE